MTVLTACDGTGGRVRRIAASGAAVAVAAGALFTFSAVMATPQAHAEARNCAALEAEFNNWAIMYNSLGGTFMGGAILNGARATLSESRAAGC
jgi:hypothetical protein